jgi:peptidoglycan/LPS O-acetylase OafA/YrhL
MIAQNASPNIKYKIQLDHIRAFGAFMVFTWHFLQINELNLETPKIFLFPLSLLTEGHTGVALFMTLSGYLFAKILIDKKIIFKYFFFNRILRLLPLLLVTILFLLYFKSELSFYKYFKTIIMGFFNKWPGAAWSISVEFHFYYLLPFILYFLKQAKNYFILIFIFTIGLKLLIYSIDGTVQHYSYWKIIGHIDEFLLGMLSYKYRNYIKNKKKLVLFVFTSFMIFYYYFENKGGFYEYPSYPSTSMIWVFLPAIQGLSYALLISYYDNNHFSFLTSKLSILISKIGLFSYSIYLWHYIYVFDLAKIINNYFIDMNSIYIGCLLAVPCFLLTAFIGCVSYYTIEKPFLKLRKRYIN